MASMRERKSEPKESSYLSYEYQRNGIQRLEKEFKRELEYYVESKGVKKENPKDIQIDINKKDLTKAELALYVVSELNLVKQQFLHKLAEDEKKPLDKRIGENNIQLKNYLNQVKIILNQGKWLLATKIKRDPKRLNKAFETLIKLADNEINFLDRAIETQVFQVTMPKPEYLKMKAQAGTFQYEGRPAVVGNAVGGVAVMAGSTLFLLPLAFIDVLGAGGKAIEAGMRGIGAGARMVADSVMRYGRHCKQDIPPEYFAAKVKLNDKNVIVKVDGPQGENRPVAADELVTFYIVDARKPVDVFNFGTNYHLNTEGVINPHGHVIFFENPLDAVRFAQDRGSTLDYYDPQAGWRLHHKWSEQERREVHGSLAAVAVAARPTPSAPPEPPAPPEPLPTPRKSS